MTEEGRSEGQRNREEGIDPDEMGKGIAEPALKGRGALADLLRVLFPMITDDGVKDSLKGEHSRLPSKATLGRKKENEKAI